MKGSAQETEVFQPQLAHPCLDYRLKNSRGFGYSQPTPVGMSALLCLILSLFACCSFLLLLQLLPSSCLPLICPDGRG